MVICSLLGVKVLLEHFATGYFRCGNNCYHVATGSYNSFSFLYHFVACLLQFVNLWFTHPVPFSSRLVSEKTVEENILKKANQKRMLGDVAIEGGNFTTASLQQVCAFSMPLITCNGFLLPMCFVVCFLCYGCIFFGVWKRDLSNTVKFLTTL